MELRSAAKVFGSIHPPLVSFCSSALLNAHLRDQHTSSRMESSCSIPISRRQANRPFLVSSQNNPSIAVSSGIMPQIASEACTKRTISNTICVNGSAVRLCGETDGLPWDGEVDRLCRGEAVGDDERERERAVVDGEAGRWYSSKNFRRTAGLMSAICLYD